MSAPSLCSKPGLQAWVSDSAWDAINSREPSFVSSRADPSNNNFEGHLISSAAFQLSSAWLHPSSDIRSASPYIPAIDHLILWTNVEDFPTVAAGAHFPTAFPTGVTCDCGRPTGGLVLQTACVIFTIREDHYPRGGYAVFSRIQCPLHVQGGLILPRGYCTKWLPVAWFRSGSSPLTQDMRRRTQYPESNRGMFGALGSAPS